MTATKNITTNNLVLHPTPDAPSQQSLLLNSGTTRFSFEMPLPSGIPETVHCTQVNVDYNLTLSMDYKQASGITYKMHEEIVKDIILARLPESGILTGDDYPNTIDSHKHFSNWCQYRITLDKKAIALGSSLPLHIEVAPTVKGLRINQVFLQLLERRNVKPEHDTQKSSQLCHFLRPDHAMALPAQPLDAPWEGKCDYLIPDDGSIAHSTESYPGFQVTHTLLVSLLISLPDDKDGVQKVNTRTISFQTQLDVLDSHFSQLGDVDVGKLPAYDCPISLEEIEKLNQHGLNMDCPPAYDTIIAA